MNKRGDGIIDEHIGWILAAVLLIILLIGLFFIGNPLLRWIGYLPDYNYNQGDNYVGDVVPDVKLPDEQVRYCPAKIGDVPDTPIRNTFVSPKEYLSFIDQDGKYSIGTSFYFKGSSEEGTIYFGEAEDIVIADVRNGLVILRPEIFQGDSTERYLIWFNYLSNQPNIFQLKFLIMLSSLHNSQIYPGKFICHPDKWENPSKKFTNFWPSGTVGTIDISSINKNGNDNYERQERRN